MSTGRHAARPSGVQPHRSTHPSPARYSAMPHPPQHMPRRSSPRFAPVLRRRAAMTGWRCRARLARHQSRSRTRAAERRHAHRAEGPRRHRIVDGVELRNVSAAEVALPAGVSAGVLFEDVECFWARRAPPRLEPGWSTGRHVVAIGARSAPTQCVHSVRAPPRPCRPLAWAFPLAGSLMSDRRESRRRPHGVASVFGNPRPPSVRHWAVKGRPRRPSGATLGLDGRRMIGGRCRHLGRRPVTRGSGRSVVAGSGHGAHLLRYGRATRSPACSRPSRRVSSALHHLLTDESSRSVQSAARGTFAPSTLTAMPFRAGSATAPKAGVVR